MTAPRSALTDRPLITTPPALRGRAVREQERRRIARQPGLGFAGLLLVVPVAVLLAVGAGGPERSALVLGPLITFALPAVVMVAFWWEDWPGSRLRPGWSGLVDTVVVAAAAVLLTMLGQLVVGRWDPRALFSAAAGPGHHPTFPATMPFAAAAFVAMLQLTLVSEGWPLRRLGRFSGGVAAMAVAWAAAFLVYVYVVDGLLSGGQLGALLVLVGVWQIWLFVVWQGWPSRGLRVRWQRLVAANAVVIGGAFLTYGLAYGVAGVPPATLSAVGGCFVAAGLLVAMLFEGWVPGRLGPLAATVVLAAALYVGLSSYADSLRWSRLVAQGWVTHVALNAVAVAVILHVAIGCRWPFAVSADRRRPG